MSARYVKMLKAMLAGSVTSLEVFFLTLLFAIPLAMIIAMGRMSKNKPLSGATNLLLLVIRGTPLMLQLLVVYFGPGIFFNWLRSFGYEVNLRWERFPAAIVALSLNYACYFAEIYRGGIQSVPKGQQEAGQVLGMTKSQIFFKVTLLQMIKRILPPISNEIITLVKDTSLARVVALQEIIWMGEEFLKGSRGIAGAIWPLFFTGAYYLVFSGILTALLNRAERRLDFFKA